MEAISKKGGGKALLIAPMSFYSFADVLSKALSKAGYDVVIANDEYPANMLGKILGKLKMFWLLSAITKRTLYRKYVSGKHYDLVLIVKGRGVSTGLLEKCRHATGRIVAYNFDSFGYNPSALRWYRDVDKYCTFDYMDSKKYAVDLVELFSSVPADETPKRIVFDISAILRNHSNRLKYLDEVLKIVPSEKIFIYILELNFLTFFFNFLRNPFLYWKYRSCIHFQSLPYRDYVSVLKNSNFTIDYAHPKQSGITIRCFEALTSQTKIITNNAFVRCNAFFNDNNTIIFDGKSSQDEVLQRFETIRHLVPANQKRTVSDFLNDLLAQPERSLSLTDVGLRQK